MAISEERIDELLDIMMNNADSEGWCYVPDGLTIEEEEELSKRLAIIAMQDRIDTLLKPILVIVDYLTNLDIDELDNVEKSDLKDELNVIKEDSQSILMDLHSTDIISNFFRVTLINNPDENITESLKLKENLIEISNNQFKDQLNEINDYCVTMVNISNQLLSKIN